MGYLGLIVELVASIQLAENSNFVFIMKREREFRLMNSLGP